jgi:hypothetical protein
MGEFPEDECIHYEICHVAWDVAAYLVVTGQSAPARHSSKGSLDDPAARQYLEAFLVSHLAHDLDRELIINRHVHQPALVMGTVGDEVLELRPALADRLDDEFDTLGILSVGRGQVSISRCPWMSTAICRLRSFVFLVVSYPPTGALWVWPSLALQHCGGRTGLAALQFMLDHDCDVLDGSEQKTPQQLA